MKQLLVSEILPPIHLPRGALHESGERLFEPGENLTHADLAVLAKVGIDAIHLPPDEDSAARFIHLCRNRRIHVTEIEEGVALAQSLFAADGNLLLKEGVVINRGMKDRLLARDVQTVYVRKSSAERGVATVDAFLTARRAASAAPPWGPEDTIPDASLLLDPSVITADRLDDALNAAPPSPIAPSGTPLVSLFRKVSGPRPTSVKEEFAETHEEASRRFFELVKDLATNKQADGDRVGATCRSIIDRIIEDSNLLFNMVNRPGQDRYLGHHSVNVTALTTCIAATMGYSRRQVLEMAFGAYLGDVGMVRIPDTILQKPARLTPRERAEIERHPFHALTLLQRIRGIPQSTPYVVYQAHERMDRSGYPRGRPGHAIHPYARIVMVADVYDALTSPRPWRKAALPYEAMEMILKMVAKKKLDGNVVRAFLAGMGLFPIGSYVELNNGSLAKVVRPNARNFTKPTVVEISRGSRTTNGNVQIDLGLEPDLQVLRAYDPSRLDADVMSGF